MSKKQLTALFAIGMLMVAYLSVVGFVKCHRSAEVSQEVSAPIESLNSPIEKSSSVTEKQSAIPMWIFNPYSTEDEIRNALTEDRIIDKEDSFVDNGAEVVRFSSSQFIVEYLGVDWDNYVVSISDGALHYAWLGILGHNNIKLSKKDIQSLVKDLDSMYGKHRQRGIEDRDARIWDWVKDDVNILLFVAKTGKNKDFAMLGFEKGSSGIMESILRYAEESHK